MNNYPKFYIGPMSKNIVDAIIEYTNETGQKVGMIPSRRQIEWDGGYVNNWETEDFALYVRTKSKNIILQRDHAGPGQGNFDDNGFESLKKDAPWFDMIHIDPWKKYPEYKDGLRETADMIAYASALNPNLKFEVGTEEAIRKFEVEELNEFLLDLKFYLGKELFGKIVYLTIQSGTAISGTFQAGVYNKYRLSDMVVLCRKNKLLSKEHNGDYMGKESLRDRFSHGLDSLNIAPEFGYLETKTYLKHCDSETFNNFYQLVYESKKYEKWLPNYIKPEDSKTKVVEVAGHYVFSHPRFEELVKSNLPDKIDEEVKFNIKSRLIQLHGTV